MKIHVDGKDIELTPEEAAEFEAKRQPAPVIPQSLPRRQAMAVLIKRGHLAEVQAILDGIPGIEGELARNDFKESLYFERKWPLIEKVRLLKGWSQEYVDGMFIEGESL